MRNSEWPSDADVPQFRETTEAFMAKCAVISNQVCEAPIPPYEVHSDFLLLPHCLSPLKLKRP